MVNDAFGALEREPLTMTALPPTARTSWQLEIPDGGCILGQPASVTLFPRREVNRVGELQCRLRCVRFVPREAGHTASGSGVTTIWSSSWSMPSATIDPTRGLEITLPFPEIGQPTVVDRKGSVNLIWQLNVVIASAGRSEEPVFDVPVRRDEPALSE